MDGHIGKRCIVGLLLLLSATAAVGQQLKRRTVERKIMVEVVDGRNGKPLPHQHLLIFTGESGEAVKSHTDHTDILTDDHGIGTFTVEPDEEQAIQVWADGLVLCQADPDRGSFSTGDILSKGLAAPNNCGTLQREPGAGHFIVFVRPPKLPEKQQ